MAAVPTLASAATDKRHVPVARLQVGMFIELDLGWLDHPFASSRFKISNPAQIQTLRELNLISVRYDPARSDSGPLPEALDAESEPQVASPPRGEVSAALVGRERLARQRQALAECERRFLGAADALRQINQNLFSQPAESLAAANALAAEMLHTMLGDTEVVLQLMGEASGRRDLYFHSLNVAVLAMILAREMALPRELLHALAVGSLFHDIGEVELPPQIRMKSETLTVAERRIVEQHTVLGEKIGARLKLPGPVLKIVRHHHEHYDGSGYPDGLKGTEIGKLAAIVAIADRYDRLCNASPESASLTPYEALSRIYTRERAHYEPDMLQLFVRCVGVYPPGSLVQLGDGRYGMVISINSRSPLRPTLVVHDACVPRQDAPIIDLEQETQVSISRSLRRSQLAREVLVYLNPRTRMIYYFDEAEPATAHG